MAYEFKLPDIGEGLTEGEVVTWLVKEGDQVVDDQPMVEVMTDKATVEITAPCAGTIADIRAEEGETIPVGHIMVVIDNGTGAAAAAPAPPSSITTITFPTGTTSPSAARIFAIVPARGAVISTVALSVMTSTIGWSSATTSPSFTSHLTTSPSVRPSPMSGR